MEPWYRFADFKDKSFIELLETLGDLDFNNPRYDFSVAGGGSTLSVQVLLNQELVFSLLVFSLHDYPDFTVFNSENLQLKFAEGILKENLEHIRELKKTFASGLEDQNPSELWDGMSFETRKVLTESFGGFSDKVYDYFLWSEHPMLSIGDSTALGEITGIEKREVENTCTIEDHYIVSSGEAIRIRNLHLLSVPVGSIVIDQFLHKGTIVNRLLDLTKKEVRYAIRPSAGPEIVADVPFNTYFSNNQILGVLRWGPSNISKVSRVVV